MVFIPNIVTNHAITYTNTTVVAIFPNVCLWRRSLCSDLVLTLKNRIVEPPSYARTAYVVAIWPSFLFDSFVKIGQLARFFGANGLPPPLAKNFPYAYALRYVVALRIMFFFSLYALVNLSACTSVIPSVIKDRSVCHIKVYAFIITDH